MKILTSALLTCALALTGCAYLHDRARDTCDVITIAAETGHANASIQIGKGTLGAGISGGKGFGLRSGALGVYEYAEINMILLGSKALLPREYDILRGKGYDYHFYWYPWRRQEDELDVDLDEGGKFNLLQIEFAACLGIGARIGFNFAELVDWGLGIFTIDILEDDLATIEKNEQIQHQEKISDNNRLNPISGSSIKLPEKD